MGILPVFTAPIGMVVCSGFVGFFYSSAGPVNAEVCFIITKPKSNSLAYGFLSIAAGLGWILGAPVAGKFYTKNISRSVLKTYNSANTRLVSIKGYCGLVNFLTIC